jgi:hypothetical protein
MDVLIKRGNERHPGKSRGPSISEGMDCGFRRNDGKKQFSFHLCSGFWLLNPVRPNSMAMAEKMIKRFFSDPN